MGVVLVTKMDHHGKAAIQKNHIFLVDHTNQALARAIPNPILLITPPLTADVITITKVGIMGSGRTRTIVPNRGMDGRISNILRLSCMSLGIVLLGHSS